jgi:hypothetical protein
MFPDAPVQYKTFYYYMERFRVSGFIPNRLKKRQEIGARVHKSAKNL